MNFADTDHGKGVSTTEHSSKHKVLIEWEIQDKINFDNVRSLVQIVVNREKYATELIHL